MNCLDGSGKILDLAFDGYTSDRNRILKFPRLDATPNFILEVIADVEGGHRPTPGLLAGDEALEYFARMCDLIRRSKQEMRLRFQNFRERCARDTVARIAALSADCIECNCIGHR
jgi:hypothetical protein